MSTPNDKIIQLKEDLVGICISHRCDQWRNSWMFDSTNSYLKYYHLIYFEDNHGLHYDDIEDLQIGLQYNNYYKKYRLDIETRYRIHNYWLFSDDKWLLVEKYVKEIVKTQYNNIQKIKNLISLSDDADFENESKKVYFEMNIKLRKDKLKIINENKM